MKRIINALFFIAVLTLASSCTQELGQDIPVPGKEEAEVMLQLRASDSRGTRLSFEDENKINDVFVLVFKGSTLTDIRQGHHITGTPGHSDPAYSGSGTFTVKLSASVDNTDTYRLVVLANAGAILESTIGLDAASVPSKNYNALVASVWNGVQGGLTQSRMMPIPMWGEIADVVVAESTPTQTIALTRAIARVDAGVGKAIQQGGADRTNFIWDGKDIAGEDIPFELTNIYVMRPNNRFAVIPTGTGATPTIPAGTQAFSVAESINLFGYPVTGGRSSSRAIYVPEADVIMGGKPGDFNHTERMAIVVGGKYAGGGETFYRLDFAKEGDLMNVLRNTLYQFNISRVSGPGFPDPETAYRNWSMNMQVDIIEWDVTDTGEIFVDGPYRIALQNSRNENRADRMAVVYREAGTTDIIAFRTSANITLNDLEMELNHGGQIPTGPEYEGRKVIQNDRFMVELKEDNSYGRYFEFTALEDFSADAVNNPSVLTVTTAHGRITFDIRIIQRNVDPHDWNKGWDVGIDLEGQT